MKFFSDGNPAWSRLKGKISRAPSILFIKFIKSGFSFWQRLGLHVVPNHFYEPIPDTRKISEKRWAEDSLLVGVDMNEDGQLALLRSFETRYKTEYNAIYEQATGIPHRYRRDNPSFGVVDAEILHCMVRHFRPRRIFEIGSGNTTYLSATAVLINQEQHGTDCELVSFEPYPNEVLRNGFPGLSKLVRKPVQEIPVDEFSKLEENDILFIDSSHVLKIGSDVQYEYLEILPRLNKGVIVHMHDIFLPTEYPREWVQKNHVFWNEQYLLQAFLTFNDAFEVLWGGSFMHLEHADLLEGAFPFYKGERDWPGSFWMRKVR